MSRSQFELRRDQYLKALARLHEVLDVETSGTTVPLDIVRDSAIQRFEFTFETAWLALREWLETQGVVEKFPRTVLAAAFAGGLIQDEAGWSDLQDARNKSSHTYDEEKAREVMSVIRNKAISLLDQLAAKLRAL